jgi:hypothetical protein
MRFIAFPALGIGLALAAAAADFTPAPQRFHQEIARRWTSQDRAPTGSVRLIETTSDGVVRAFVGGQWHEFRAGQWMELAALRPSADSQFVFADGAGRAVRVPVPWREVRQIARFKTNNFLATVRALYATVEGKVEALNWPADRRVYQIAVSSNGVLHVASDRGLFQQSGNGWIRRLIPDGRGRTWAAADVLGVAFDAAGQLWFATKAGVGVHSSDRTRFYEGKDGLPWNDFTCITAGPEGEVWFGTRLGAIRFDGRQWHYRQGPRWLPHDEVTQIAVDAQGTAWFATAAGVGGIERRPMTLAEKAKHYEQEIERYLKRTPFGYVAEAPLGRAGDKSTAQPHDTDNDGLWTAMYGAGECFAYAATRDPRAKARARQAFAALRFLQKVTQGGSPAPPKGYIARTIRPADWPDPNVGRLARDRTEQQRDRLWKVYEPRWPKSADGQWFWKSDTSSDELDGHYFFYPLYFDFCADTEAERERVREVVRDVTDHLLAHRFVLLDHDGRPTRWGIYGPHFLNRDPDWWPERGLKSLSILSYLAVAAHVTGDAKYTTAARELIEQHGYAMNAMYPKVQHGPGSGNQSDDEMAFMCFYGLLRCSQDEQLKELVRFSFFRYWVNEAPEMNPFFNFAYAAHNLAATASNPWGTFPLRPWPGWHEDALTTLRGFPLDRLDWPHRNSHRLDIIELAPVHSRDLYEPQGRRTRGHLVNGRVLPVENRHFNHWNTDPWRLDYPGHGSVLGAGTVFLLPYYMGLYHGFIERP